MTQPRQDQERDEAGAPVPVEAAADLAQHSGTVIHLLGDRYAWTCACGSGRDVSAATDWETAAGELRDHRVRVAQELIDNPLYVIMPEAEYRAILDVVSAARELHTDILMGLVADEAADQTQPQRRREYYQGVYDELKRFDELVDALPPQAPEDVEVPPAPTEEEFASLPVLNLVGAEDHADCDPRRCAYAHAKRHGLAHAETDPEVTDVT